MLLTIKNMISQRCKMIVSGIVTDFGLEAEYIQLGEILLKENLSAAHLFQLNRALKKAGLELIFDKNGMIAQRVENVICEIIQQANEPLQTKFSYYLSRRLNYSYTYLANIFKKINGISIEQFIIRKKIDKVKVMLLAEGFTLNEIAAKMNYSSVSHLSAQFKKVTGLSARDFKLRKTKSYFRMTDLIAV